MKASRPHLLAVLMVVAPLLAVGPARSAFGQDGMPPTEVAATGEDPLAEVPASTAIEPTPGLGAEPAEDALPPLTQRADGHRSEVEAAWFSGGSNLTGRAQSARFRALQLGARNYEAAARALLSAGGEGAERREQTMLAVRLAPDLPLAHMELARAYLKDREYAAAAAEVLAGVRAIPKNLEATLWLAATLLAMFAAVLTIGSLLFIVWVGASVFRHAAHDFGDLVSKSMPDFARAALLATALLVPVLLGEGLMGVVLVLFLLGFLYREGGYRRALVVSAVLLLIGLYPITRLAGTALTALDSDPVASAAHAVVRSMTSPSDIDRLQAAGEEDWLARASLALHERRSGTPDAAGARYEHLLGEAPGDPVALANLSNIHFARAEYERAIQLGEEAAGLTKSATLLFNLSQVYARSFRMEEFEGAMSQAQNVDLAVVADLSRTAAPDFVADLAFPLGPIRDRMLQSAGGDRFLEPVARVIMPGRLGESWMNLAGVFVLAGLFAMLAGGRWEHSSCCGRCGRRVCNRCDGNVWNSQICDGCHHLFHRPETTDPAMRMARLSELRLREARLGHVAVAASLLLPGVGGLLARRPDLSLLGLFFFAWGSIVFLWRDGIVADPLAIGAAGSLIFAIAGGMAVLGYLGVVSVSLATRRSL